MRCLYCHEKVQEEINLINLFQSRRALCRKCETSLIYWREGRRCSHCHRLMKTAETECNDCFILGKIYPRVNKITCILDYNEEVKMLFHRLKFVRDAALAEIIAMFLKYKFREYDVIIPIPISDHRLSERGFNQTSLVLDILNIQYMEILITDKVKRQSDLGKACRLRSQNPFRFKEAFNMNVISGRKILIVDDIYTTGITAHQASAILYTGQPRVIDVLTFSKA